MTQAPVEQRLAGWRDNLIVTRGDPVCGDILHGPALDFVIEQIDNLLRPEQSRPSDARCEECAGTGYSERIDGFELKCPACHGDGTRPSDPSLQKAQGSGLAGEMHAKIKRALDEASRTDPAQEKHLHPYPASQRARVWSRNVRGWHSAIRMTARVGTAWIGTTAIRTDAMEPPQQSAPSQRRRGEMAHSAEQFIAANDKSLVVQGVVASLTEGGGRYTLENRKVFELSREETIKLPEGYPKWKLP